MWRFSAYFEVPAAKPRRTPVGNTVGVKWWAVWFEKNTYSGRKRIGLRNKKDLGDRKSSHNNHVLKMILRCKSNPESCADVHMKINMRKMDREK